MIQKIANPLSGEGLEAYLTNYGWEFTRCGPLEWQTGFRGKIKPFPIVIQMSDTWIDFKVMPLMHITQDWNFWPEILHFMLQLNEVMQLGKVSLDADGQINLSIQALNDNFQYPTFETLLGILGYYADSIYEELVHYFDEVGFCQGQPQGFLI